MVSRVQSVAFVGVEARPVTVECALTPGLPAFNLVGLPDKAVSEARERVRAALTAIGLGLPPQRITMNLSPADLPKAGSHFDLPIALALMTALGVVPPEEAAGYVALGELALDGSLRPVQGALPAALAAAGGGQGLICPAGCGPEAAWVGACEVLAAPGLVDLINHFAGRAPLGAPEPGPVIEIEGQPDLLDVKGQETARRAIEVAAAGGHHLLMVGEPGSGKSMLARRIPSILPPLSPAEALEVATIRSLAAESAGQPGAMSRVRPFRDPHHTASRAALVGGGTQAKPGEISLAHRGVLFLDELPEFDPRVLESLRQPLETGEILVSRANAHVTYPARFLLAAAMNPCRCGYLTDAGRACSRAPRCGSAYTAKISGPLLDRFDIRLEVPPVTPAVLALPSHGEGSAKVGARVAEARGAQVERANGHGPACNAELEGAALDRAAEPDAPGLALLQAAAERYRYSARGYHRVLRLARTIADLDGAVAVGRVHVAEAVSYRRMPG
ncbi:YifB family Mg chelatase-like AAA ATPase [Paralimibaculum aggregatum]|uniref:YifB family Mg chelatase-like AAA ATPase n=1 Tax=Paralimibaculum aggregatum TaxID=3036245 RepID=A0ABQ6LT54_9RHOB|nr:YifB family Mg chelatase-like AAA ATPase [Limibaculum sp. NKW23]GMG85269.1 YifB family Mg chelatase-like AAA ATPase [Limibaculum sp. NKW23]